MRVSGCEASHTTPMTDLDRYAFLPGAASPIQVARTEGSFLITPDGTRILDASGGAIVSNVGHGRREVAEAVGRALAEVDYVVPPFHTPSRQRLIERLQDRWLPGDVRRCVFTSGGSESVDSAIRVARQHFVSKGEPSRYKVIGRGLSYHGVTLGSLAVGGHTKRRAGMEPLLTEHPRIPPCYPLRCAMCQGSCDLSCADVLREVIEREGAETVAAFIAEPIGGSTAGALTPPDGYWPRIAEICREYGILLIADEVMSGFGRTGKRFAVEHWDVTPDLLVGGKGLAGGYAPMGAVFAREEVVQPIAEARDEIMFFTYAAHPASCAAAEAVLDIMERENLVERAAEMGELLSRRLASLAEHPNVAEVRGRGLLQAVEIVADRESRAPFPAEAKVTGRIVAAGVADGVFFYPGGCGPARDVVVLGPPFTISPDEIDQIASVLEKAIDGVVARVSP